MTPRSSCFSLDQACSMGLKSGEYGADTAVARRGFDQLAEPGDFVGSEIVGDHDMPRFRARRQHLLHEGKKRHRHRLK